ncbi:ANTAR domain-containing response regulator [Paenibacillus sp. GCM10023252]|uniref:ANTAR domain-containing response regulator n=1 Tax=Paenibacillus sp. GCM10023252 TaxID=3252649 RepID=UPI0036078ED7
MLSTILLITNGHPDAQVAQLQQNCRTLHLAKNEEESQRLISVADAVVLHVPLEKMNEWQNSAVRMRKLPIFWYSCAKQELPREMDWGYSLDGLLFPSMTAYEMQYALRWGVRCFLQRKRWGEEREQLMQRLEERKWIDQAKSVLCEIKGISEAEAYDFLRKQAMNERKRIGDIAMNIVKVYQLIHG